MGTGMLVIVSRDLELVSLLSESLDDECVALTSDAHPACSDDDDGQALSEEKQKHL
jgi:hypothetical protein